MSSIYTACAVKKIEIRSMDRDLNAAHNLAALAGQITGSASSPSCGATLNEPAGNPLKTSHAGRGYRHGKPHQGNAA